ncbi:hypothetical protein C8F01DRAFT_550550 [Mycena amicta]|nr:hypothetical protein C8F01DRAFT_550550 [Mycena amicta]
MSTASSCHRRFCPRSRGNPGPRQDSESLPSSSRLPWLLLHPPSEKTLLSSLGFTPSQHTSPTKSLKCSLVKYADGLLALPAVKDVLDLKIVVQNPRLDNALHGFNLQSGSKYVCAVAKLESPNALRVRYRDESVSRLIAGAREFGHHEGARVFAANAVEYFAQASEGATTESKYAAGIFKAPPQLTAAEFNAKVDEVFRRLAEAPVLQDGYHRLTVFYQNDDVTAEFQSLRLPAVTQSIALALGASSDWDNVLAVRTLSPCDHVNGSQ